MEKTDAAEDCIPDGAWQQGSLQYEHELCKRGIRSTDGAPTITPRQVILTSATDEKVYDGTPLTNHECNRKR
ncbi:MAG: hypothetical protein ACLSGK_15170 [Lachnospiraceae bacterium]